jgi:16S rRNA processing protein RimM
MNPSCPSGFFLLGVVIKTHGVKGALRARLDVFNLADYTDSDQFFLWKPTYSAPKPFDILSMSPQSNNEVILCLTGVESIENANALVGTSICLPESHLAPLEGNQFYYHEVIGFLVVDESLGPIGTIRDVYEMPAQDLLAVFHLGKECLIPIHDAFIARVDRDAQTIFTTLPEGLIDTE